MPSSQAVAALLLLLVTTVQSLVQLGDKCFYDKECGALNAFCRDRKVCACIEGFRPAESFCLATVGARCLSDNDCSSLEYSECNAEGKGCACKEGYVPHSSSKYCLAVVYEFEGLCQENSQCQESFGAFALCDDSMCKCMEGKHEADGKCWTSKGLGEVCFNSSECSYAQAERHKVECWGGRCLCKSGWSEYKHACEVVYEYNRRCDSDSSCKQLFGGLAFCDSSVCRCIDSKQEAGDKCWYTKGLGEACHSSSQCSFAEGQRDKVHCLDGTCQCKSGWSNKGVCEDGAAQITLSLAAAFFVALRFVVL